MCGNTLIYAHTNSLTLPTGWHQQRFTNVTCARSWRLCGFISAIHATTPQETLISMVTETTKSNPAQILLSFSNFCQNIGDKNLEQKSFNICHSNLYPLLYIIYIFLYLLCISGIKFYTDFKFWRFMADKCAKINIFFTAKWNNRSPNRRVLNQFVFCDRPT